VEIDAGLFFFRPASGLGFDGEESCFEHTGDDMKNNARKQGTRMELKYCEHCGGLWLRESGAGVVYCENCQPKVADLPEPKVKPGRLNLPVRQRTVVEEYAVGMDDPDKIDFEAAGGAA
jgi:hypothetical protein